MEEAIGDVSLDLKPPPSECCFQPGVQEDMVTDNRDQAQLPLGVQEEASRLWLLNRAAQIEALRLSIVSGTYQVDTAELALCILYNTTHFLETR
jgi:anti-sigma28 factor (negative regulator of flagellin synthesis)